MKPLFTIVVTILVLTANAHPENIEDVKQLPQTKEPLVEAEASEPQTRVERCTTCTGTTSLKIKSPNDVLAAIQQLPSGEVHTQQSFESCTSEKGCAGLKVKDGRVVERFGSADAFKNAAAQNTGNEFTFHAAGSLGNLLEGANGEGPFWWMNQNSPFKNAAAQGGNFEKFSKSSSSFSTTGSGGAGLDIAANPFLNGDFSKLAGGFTSGGASFTSQGGEVKPNYQSSSFESSSFSSASKGDVDLASNPFLNGAINKFGQSGFQAQGNLAGGFGNSQSNFNQASYGSSSKFGASGSGYTGSTPTPFTASTGANVNLIQNTQKASEFDFEQQQQTQQNIDEAFQHTGNVNAHEHSGGDLQQTCAGQGYVCVPKAQCNNGVVNTNGGSLLQANTQKQYCNTRSEICCRIETTSLSGGANLQGSLGVGSATFAASGSQGGLFATGQSGSTGQSSFNGQSGSASGQSGSFNGQSSFGQASYNGQSQNSGSFNKATTTGFGSQSNFGNGVTTSFEADGSNKFGSTVSPSKFGSNFNNEVYKATSQSNFIETDSFSAGSEQAGVFRPGASGSGLKPGIPYLPPIDSSTAGSNVISSTVYPTTPRPRPTTPRPFTTPRPTFVPSTSAPGYLPPIGESTNTQETRLPNPNYSEGEIILDESRQPTRRPTTFSPGPSPNDIPAGCAAALKCTPIEYCTAEGVISNTTVVLTRDQEAYRVPLTDCKDLETGRVGKCCRDPYYTDPWPTNQIGKWVPGVFGGNDGKYVPDSRGSPTTNVRPAVTARPPTQPITGSVILNNFRTTKPTVGPTLGPNQLTPGFPSSTPGTFIKGQFDSQTKGQGSYSSGGQGSYTSGGQGQVTIGGQGQYGNAGLGQTTQGGQYGQGSGFTQTTSSSFGQTTKGQGQYVKQGVGQGVTQGVGQTVIQGQSSYTKGGVGQYDNLGQADQTQYVQTQGVSQGQGQVVTQGQGFGITQGSGQTVKQGGGQIVSQGVGQTTTQGFGFGVVKGQGQTVTSQQGQGSIQGQGQTVSQGQGFGINKGQGEYSTQGQGQTVTQGIGIGVTKGQGQYVSQGQGQIVGQGQGFGVTKGQGQFTSQGQGIGVTKGQGQYTSQGQGFGVSKSQGQIVSQGQGFGVSKGQGEIVSQGQGFGVSKGQGQIVSQGQGFGVTKGQGQFTSQGQGFGVTKGQGQFTSQGQGFGVSKGQGQAGITGSGQQVTQGSGFAVTQGQGVGITQGQGESVTQGIGFGVTQGGGFGVNQGSGQSVSQGAGFGVTQGFGQTTSTGGGFGVQGSSQTTGQGFGVSQGEGQYVSKGFGSGVTQGFGSGVSQGQGQAVSQGSGFGVSTGGGFGVSQGQGQYVKQGGGQTINQGEGGFGIGGGIGFGINQGLGFGLVQGQGQKLTQGVGSGEIRGEGFKVTQGGGFGLQDYSESVQRVFLQQYSGDGQCGLLNPQKPYGNKGDLEMDFGEIPWQAMVLLQTNRSLLCGGVITRPDVVVTSAACVEGLDAKNVLIKGGEWKLGIDDEPLPFQIVQVKTILRHPFYRRGSLKYDAAILVLSENLRLAKNIYPICLPGASETLDAFYNGAGECIVTGWGKVVLQAHLKGSIMHGLNVSLINPGECEAKLQSDYPHLLEDYDQESCVCGQPTNPLNNICKVDIGSALACTSGDGRYVFRGVYSWDSGCQIGNQIAGFFKFDLEWYQWAIGLIESTRFAKYSTGTKVTKNQYTGINSGIKTIGIKGGSGQISSSGVGSGILTGQVSGSGISGGQVNGISGGKISGSVSGAKEIAGANELNTFAQGLGQFGFGSSKYTESSSGVKGLNLGTQIKGPISNTFSATYTEKKVFQSEPKYVTYTTKPEIVTFTTKPEYFTYTTKPKLVTYTTKPEIVTYTTKPEIVTFTTKPEIVTYTTKPKIVSYTTKPQFIRYETSGSVTNPQYVAPGVTFNPSLSDVVNHKHSASCKCLQGK